MLYVNSLWSSTTVDTTYLCYGVATCMSITDTVSIVSYKNSDTQQHITPAHQNPFPYQHPPPHREQIPVPTIPNTLFPQNAPSLPPYQKPVLLIKQINSIQETKLCAEADFSTWGPFLFAFPYTH